MHSAFFVFAPPVTELQARTAQTFLTDARILPERGRAGSTAGHSLSEDQQARQ